MGAQHASLRELSTRFQRTNNKRNFFDNSPNSFPFRMVQDKIDRNIELNEQKRNSGKICQCRVFVELAYYSFVIDFFKKFLVEI